jgi:hypothetical protein
VVGDVAVGADHGTWHHVHEGPDAGAWADAVALDKRVVVDERAIGHAPIVTAGRWGGGVSRLIGKYPEPPIILDKAGATDQPPSSSNE